MTEDDKIKIRSVKHERIVEDPYPQIAEWEQREQFRKNSIFGKLLNHKTMPSISPHKAWLDGFNFAWKLIEYKLATMKTCHMGYDCPCSENYIES